MANLKKEAKRGKDLPRIINGHISTGTKVDWLPPDERGMCTARVQLHTLNIWQIGADAAAYQVELTDDEMLRVTSEWLSRYYQTRKKNVQIT